MVARSIELPLDDDGRVTIPIDTRREMGMKPGDIVRLEIVPRSGVTEELSSVRPHKPEPVADVGARHQLPAFFRHAGTLEIVDELDEDEDFESRIRDVMEDAAIQRYRRSL